MTDDAKYKKLYLIMRDISNALVIADRTVPLTDYLLDVAMKYVSAESGSLMIVNERGGLSILAARGLDASYIKSFGSRGDDGICGTILKKRSPVLVRDIRRHPEYLDSERKHYRTHSFISCPLMFRNQLLGIINVNDKKDGSSFTQEELDLLQIIANSAAAALENASLLSRLKTAAENLEQMNKRLIDSDIIKTEFLTSISHELRTPLNSIKGAIYCLDHHDDLSTGERREFQDIIASEADTLSVTIDNFVRFLEVEDESLLLDKWPVNITDVLTGLPSSGNLSAALSERSIRLGVISPRTPLWIVGDKLRILQLFSNLLIGIAHYLSPEDAIELSVSSSAELLSIGIDLSRPLPRTVLHTVNGDASLNTSESSGARVRVHLARNIALAHRWSIAAGNEGTVSRIVITCPLNQREILNAYINRRIDRFVDFIVESMDIDICSVLVNDDLTGNLRVASARGLDQKIVKTASIRPGDQIAGWVALEGKPLLISDIETDARFLKKSIPQYNSHSLMSLPLKVDGRIIGVLNLNNKKTSEPFTQQDYDRALALTDSFTDHLRDAFTSQLSEEEIVQLMTSLDADVSAPYLTPRPSP
jgi:GAF domain-containing protein